MHVLLGQLLYIYMRSVGAATVYLVYIYIYICGWGSYYNNICTFCWGSYCILYIYIYVCFVGAATVYCIYIYIHYWRPLVIFCVSPCDSISSSGSVIGNRALCAGFFPVAGQHCCNSMGLLCDYVVKFASPSCVRFISFGFLLATTCVSNLHSVTTGSRDRANVPLIIIIIHICSVETASV